MNAIQLRLKAEEYFDKYCKQCFHSIKGNRCYPMRRAQQKSVHEIEDSYKKYGQKVGFDKDYWACFSKQ